MVESVLTLLAIVICGIWLRTSTCCKILISIKLCIVMETKSRVLRRGRRAMEGRAKLTHFVPQYGWRTAW
jgi:uridine kinase